MEREGQEQENGGAGNLGEDTGAKSPGHRHDEAKSSGHLRPEDFGDGALEIPVTEEWAAVEQELSETEREVRETERNAAREEEENARLIPLRLERLKNRPGKLSAEELKSPEKAMFTGGIGRMWNVRQAATSEARERDAAAEQRAYELDCAELGTAEADALEAQREALLNARAWRGQPPLWQQICGLTTENALALHPNQRAAGIRRLLKKVEGLIRWEVRRTERNGGGETEIVGTESSDHRNVGAESPDHCDHRVDATRRTAQWDPLRTVCLYLGIAQRKLSALSREVSGLAATQLCDAIRAETLRNTWKKRLAGWLANAVEKMKSSGETLKDRAFALFRELKAERQRTGAHRSSFAWETGFSSYTRMFRACLVCYGLAPQEMELLLIEESIGEDARCVSGQAGSKNDGLQKSDCGLNDAGPTRDENGS